MRSLLNAVKRQIELGVKPTTGSYIDDDEKGCHACILGMALLDAGMSMGRLRQVYNRYPADDMVWDQIGPYVEAYGLNQRSAHKAAILWDSEMARTVLQQDRPHAIEAAERIVAQL